MKAARLRRHIRRRGYWIILFGILASIALWRSLRPQGSLADISLQIAGTVTVPASFPLPTLPPPASNTVTPNYREVPLAEVFNDLSRQLAVPFTIDWSALKAAGLEPQTPVVLRTDSPIPISETVALLGNHKIVADYTATPVFVTTPD